MVNPFSALQLKSLLISKIKDEHCKEQICQHISDLPSTSFRMFHMPIDLFIKCGNVLTYFLSKADF